MKARKGECRAKKIIDHRIFNPSCMLKIAYDFFDFVFLSQNKHSEMPISMYKAVHTGPKIQFGGLNAGLFSEAYQVAMEGVVKTEPINPARRQIAIEKTSFMIFLIF